MTDRVKRSAVDFRTLAVLATLVWLAAAWHGLARADVPAATELASSHDPSKPDPRRMLIDQKARLVENILDSRRMVGVAESDDIEVRRLYARARELLEEARDAIAADDLEQAELALDEALGQASTASLRASRERPVRDVERQRERNSDLLGQVQTYRAAIVTALEEQGVEEDDTLRRLDRLIDDAGTLIDTGRHVDASSLLTEAYKTAVMLISELRAGQTTVAQFAFEEPADEFAYELTRNNNYETLIKRLTDEDGLAASMRNVVDRYVAKSREQRARAEAQAEAGDYSAAIKTMEAATDHLVRAAGVGGLFIQR